MMRNAFSVRTAILLIVAGMLVPLGGCASSAPEADPAALQGVEWGLTGSSVSSTDLGKAGITLTFDGTRLSGFSGVNQYGGDYTANTDGSLEIGVINATLMAGPEPLMQAESAYLQLLQDCDSFKVADGVLTLSTGGNETLTYEAAPAAELSGSSWTVTGYNNGKEAVVGPIVGSELTIEFGTDGTVAGNAGVNTFRGPFESTDKTVKIGPLAATKMGGEPELMTQEANYLQALQNAMTWSITRGMLDMRDAGGATQITAIRKD
jgi:heat shock protein HslJ